ncbi:uncharacterized protein LOC113385522 [Ctenocephalides felis]|uniref:uncharacterized protein LOC113385522 n=1 Tax=Ctenocephalides felis TaxID=7515 RepID=UPI000E6E53B1|nr:uncharacterized protein LOC113385522 [Ctenocephalides felis]
MQESNQDLSSRDGLMLPDLRGCMIPGGGGTFEGLDVLKIEPQDICDQEMTIFHHLPQHPHLMQQKMNCSPIISLSTTPPRIKLRSPAELLRPEAKKKPLQYSDLPYMGEMTLDSSKPRRGRKPKKADICHLIYKNYGTTVADNNSAATPAVVPNIIDIEKVGSLLEQRLMQEESQPLNLCVRDAPQPTSEQEDHLLCYPMALYYQNLIAAAAAAANTPAASTSPPQVPREKVQGKRKRSAIFIPPAPVEGTTNPATEVSICKFKFTGGAKPSLQEKKMLSVDSGGNFRYYSGTGDKSMRGYEFFPRETMQAGKPEQVIPEQIVEPKSNNVDHRRKRKSRRSLHRERLEQTFKEKGFLIQTQKLESAEGATYCKFRQLRKFTRYLFRSWKDYLPGELQNGENGQPVPVPIETGMSSEGATNV